MNAKQALAVGAMTLTALTLTLSGARADVHDDDNLYSREACKYSGSDFKFMIRFNSGNNGAYRRIGWSVYNFDRLHPGGSDPRYRPLKYCLTGQPSPLPGENQHIKNNAASGTNHHYKYTARVFFNSGYKGSQDAMWPRRHIDRFRNVYNNNASFKWTS